jgi:predicted GNAT family acetyltransferase
LWQLQRVFIIDITTYHKPREFLHALQKDPSAVSMENDFMLGLTQMILDDPLHFGSQLFLATIGDSSNILLAAFMTPPWPLLLYTKNSSDDDLLQEFTQYLLHHHIVPSGINAKRELADRFSRLWCERTNRKRTVKMKTRFFVLTQVKSIPQSPGYLVKADETYRDLILSWAKAFNNETTIDYGSDQLADHVDFTLRLGHAFLWIDEEPVCMTFRERPHERGVAIGFVYTPQNMRNHGYATSCVAEASRGCLAEGYRYCTLFADISNPTSNSIYQKIGYRPLCDYVIIGFDES